VVSLGLIFIAPMESGCASRSFLFPAVAIGRRPPIFTACLLRTASSFITKEQFA
jgi:hypothetical protein